MFHKILGTLGWRFRDSSLIIPLKENLYATNSCFDEKHTRIRKFESGSLFFQYAFDNKSGIHLSQILKYMKSRF